jgi:hypothetical protein
VLVAHSVKKAKALLEKLKRKAQALSKVVAAKAALEKKVDVRAFLTVSASASASFAQAGLSLIAGVRACVCMRRRWSFDTPWRAR